MPMTHPMPFSFMGGTASTATAPISGLAPKWYRPMALSCPPRNERQMARQHCQYVIIAYDMAARALHQFHRTQVAIWQYRFGLRVLAVLVSLTAAGTPTVIRQHRPGARRLALPGWVGALHRPSGPTARSAAAVARDWCPASPAASLAAQSPTPAPPCG